MVVVASIGSLAAIALPAYQDYIIRSQAASALAEITPAKVAFEEAVNRGLTPSLTDTADGFVGITKTGPSYCDVGLTFTASSGDGTIVCTTEGGNAGKFNKKAITWARTGATGLWDCTTTLDAKHAPVKGVP